MRIVDLHSHWGTERGYVLRSADALAQKKVPDTRPKRTTLREGQARTRAAGQLSPGLMNGFITERESRLSWRGKPRDWVRDCASFSFRRSNCCNGRPQRRTAERGLR